MKSKSFPIAFIVSLILASCGDSSSSGITQTGGSPGSGGQQALGGGGGSAAMGTATGGMATGGMATGGMATGGMATGGMATGGMATGGVATGGRATGGAATGGDSPTGGRTAQDTGGAPPTGGASSSGAAGEEATGGSAGAGGEGTGDPTTSEGCGSPAGIESGNGQSINVGGSNRTFNLRIPDDYDMNHPYRLMVSYHWLNGTANNVSPNYYDLWNLSEGSTIFVAPQGINNGWSNQGGADVEFSRALIEQLESQLCIDKSRIFCEGFSMGGSMSYAMASALPDMIRAIAVHSGGAMSGTTPGHDGPVAYFMTHGTQDSVCTYPNFGVPQLQDFAGVNGCTQPDPSLSANAFEAALPEPNSSAGACVSFEGCQEGYPVRACIFVGDHTASPGGNWVPGETWDFISQF